MVRIDAIVFDVFETLACNYASDWIGLFVTICQKQQIPAVPDSLFKDWRSIDIEFRNTRSCLEVPEMSPPFKSYEEAWSDSFYKTFSKLGFKGDPEQAAKDAISHMSSRNIYPDAIKAIPKIQDKLPTGVLSNADNSYLYPVLRRGGWTFDSVLSSETAKAYKPLPGPFLEISRMMNMDPSKIAYVGDSQYDDVQGAQRVGMTTIWVNRGNTKLDIRLANPDFEVENLLQILEILN